MAIFKIFLTFSAVSTFVLRSSANILDSAQRKRFLSLSPLKNWSNYSCIESEIDDKRSKTPSVESWSLPLSLARCVSNSLFISSKINALSASNPARNGCSESNKFPTNLWDFFFFFALKEGLVSVRSYISFFFVIRKKLLKVSSLATLVVLVHLSSSRRICSGNLPVSSV